LPVSRAQTVAALQPLKQTAKLAHFCSTSVSLRCNAFRVLFGERVNLARFLFTYGVTMYKLFHVPTGAFLVHPTFNKAQDALNWFADNNEWAFDRRDVLLYEYHLIAQHKLA
jgi:hypothetical protein